MHAARPCLLRLFHMAFAFQLELVHTALACLLGLVHTASPCLTAAASAAAAAVAAAASYWLCALLPAAAHALRGANPAVQMACQVQVCGRSSRCLGAADGLQSVCHGWQLLHHSPNPGLQINIPWAAKLAACSFSMQHACNCIILRVCTCHRWPTLCC